MTNAMSVKDRLKNQAVEDGKTMQDKLVIYGLKRNKTSAFRLTYI